MPVKLWYFELTGTKVCLLVTYILQNTEAKLCPK